jgi:hypothetical protein
MQALPESFAKRSQLLAKRNPCKQTLHVSVEPAVLRREFPRSKGRHCRFQLKQLADPQVELTRTARNARSQRVAKLSRRNGFRISVGLQSLKREVSHPSGHNNEKTCGEDGKDQIADARNYAGMPY